MVLRTRFLFSTVAAFGVLAVAAGARPVQAQTTLNVGNTGIANPTGLPFYGGTQVGSTQSAAFSANSGAFAVNLFSSAYSGGAGATGLDFYYQIQIVTNTNTVPVTNLSVSQFSSLLNIAAGQTTADIDGPGVGVFSSGTVASTTMSRTSTALSFDYSGFTAGNSQTLVVRTNATATNQGAATVTGTGVGAVTTSGLVLVAADLSTPEPGTLALVGTGLASGVAGFVARRRRRIAKK